MDRIKFNQLKKELELLAYPARPRPLKFFCNRDGQKVFIRQRDQSYFQQLKSQPKPFVEIRLPPKRRGTKWFNRSLWLEIERLWDWACDRLFG